MAPLPPNTTYRWFVDYRWQGGQHVMQFRTPAPLSDSDVATEIRGFLLAIAPALHTSWTTMQLRRSAAGSLLSFPVAMAAVVGTNTFSPTPLQYPRFISWVGRGPTGRRTRITVYGAEPSVSDDFRLTAGENAAIQAGVDYLQHADRTFVTIGGDEPIWAEYANAGYNAYYQRQRRREG